MTVTFKSGVKVVGVALAFALAAVLLISPTPANATAFPGWADTYLVNPTGSHQPWSTFRRAPQSFAIGNAHDGWDVYGGVSSGGYTYGYISAPDSHVQKCAWIADSNLDSTGGAYYPPPCDLSGSIFAVSTFASYTNCSSCTIAYPVTTRAGAACTDYNLYANVLPWRTTTVATDPVDTFTPGDQVNWRYISN